MPPQQPDRLLDVLDDRLRFRAHAVFLIGRGERGHYIPMPVLAACSDIGRKVQPWRTRLLVRPHDKGVSLERKVRRMTDDIAFDKSFDLAPGRVEEVAPGVRRLLCDNPSPFTFKGTVSYIIGRGEVAIIDPGPDDPQHIAALLDAVRNESVTHIFVTHTHVDHSPGAAQVKAATGAMTFAEGPHRAARPLHIGEADRLEASADHDFAPDHALADGEVIEGKGFAIEAVATPGHTANHMAFALRETGLLFSGDHVMAWNTSIIAPPDGAMADYMASLDKLLRRDEQVYLPGHGGAVREAPASSGNISPTGTPARRRSSPRCAAGRPTFRSSCGPSISGSIRGSRAPPDCPCSLIWRIWSRVGSWRRTVPRPSAPAIVCADRPSSAGLSGEPAAPA